MKYKNKTIKIFNTTYKVLFVNNIESEDNNKTIWGETNFNLKTIKIRIIDINNKLLPEHEIIMCLLHEIFHAILQEGQYINCTEDEPLVEWLARCTKHLMDQKAFNITLK